MKKLIPFLVLMVGVSGALAQGVVNFNNNVLAEPPDRTVYGVDGSALVGTNFVAQLYYGTDAGSLVAHTGAASRFRVTTTTQPGTWSGGNRTLTGGGVGTPILLQVRVWDSSAGSTFDQARAAGGTWGASEVFTYTQALSAPPASTDTQMLGLTSFTLVPEPSVIGLGLIGVGALVWLRRRKA
jgi:hypothetical protein